MLTLPQPAGEQARCVVEIRERHMRQIRGAAVFEQGAFGDHHIDPARRAEIRASITNEDTQLPWLAFGEAALAGARQGSAVAARVRETQAPAVCALPLQAIGIEGKVEVVAVEHGLYRAIEPVGHDRHAVTELPAQPRKPWKSAVDVDPGNERVHLRPARAQQVYLAHEALARADATGLPLLLDIPPCRSGKPLEQEV